MPSQFFCFSCQKEVTHSLDFKTQAIGRLDDCPSCDADMHVCKNCQFYDPNSYNECRERSADPVLEKERSNFCDYFSINSGVKGGGLGMSFQNSPDVLKAKAVALFGGSSVSSEPKSSAQVAAEALFKKK
jgi:hypothetical protein